MKPMTLKKPTPCCGSPTLLWSKTKAIYICPCGQFKATDYGKQIVSRNRPARMTFGKAAKRK